MVTELKMRSTFRCTMEEETLMDRETRHELDRLLAGFSAALEDVRAAVGDEARIKAWHQVRTLAFELNQVLPGVEQATSS